MTHQQTTVIIGKQAAATAAAAAAATVSKLALSIYTTASIASQGRTHRY
jgi:hypothetical protein